MNDETLLAQLAYIQLDESYVLGITASPGRLAMDVDFFLTPSHPHYQVPAIGEYGCYERGELVFENVTSIRWSGQGLLPARDLTGETDYGHIDSFESAGGEYSLGGDWGQLDVVCRHVAVCIS